MKSLNIKETLWTEVSVEQLENREEYAACISCIFDCICFNCICFAFW